MKEKIRIMPKRKKIVQTDKYGWVTTFEYRKSMNDFFITQSNKRFYENRFVYLNGDKLVEEIKKLMNSIDKKQGENQK
jgi:hypothetical protein